MTIWHGTMVDGEITTQENILWDRKRDGGFPGMFLCFLFLCFGFLFYILGLGFYAFDIYNAWETCLMLPLNA